MPEKNEEVGELVAKLENLERDLKKGLDQVEDDVADLENREEEIMRYEENLGSLSSKQVRKLEEDLELGTEKGQQNLEELKEVLGMEEDAVKALAQLVHHLDEDRKNVKEAEEEIDGMLEHLKKQAEKGNIDQELAARCVAEILETKEQIIENANEEEVVAEAAENLGVELSSSHRELVEMKKDEQNLEDEFRDAGKGDKTHLRDFAEQGASNLEGEMRELEHEFRKQAGEEDMFFQTMAKLADEGELTEQQIDHLITQQQEWSTVMQQVLKDSAGGFKKFGEALFSFTPQGIAFNAVKGGVKEGAEHIDSGELIDTIKDTVTSGSKEARAEVEQAMNETEEAKNSLEQAKAD
jgi:chromosome segregation ATPase